MKPELQKIFNLFEELEVAGETVSLTISSKGGKSTIKLQLESPSSPSSTTTPTSPCPAASGAPVRRRRHRGARARAQRRQRAADHQGTTLADVSPPAPGEASAPADIIDVTLATRDDLHVSAHKVILNSGEQDASKSLPSSILSSPTTVTPFSSTSTPPLCATTPTSKSSPSSPSDWKLVSSKQRTRTPPAPSPVKLPYNTYVNRYGEQVFKCKKQYSDEAVNDCHYPWTDLYCFKIHDNHVHGGPKATRE